MGRSIVVTSGKGGTGKTTLTAGVASCLAALGHRVVCVDADVGARNLDIALAMSDDMTRSRDFSDVLAGHVVVESALVPHPRIARLSLLPGPMNRRAAEIDAYGFKHLINRLTEACDFVLVDCCAGLEEGFVLATDACREAIVVATPDASSLRVAARATELIGPDKDCQLVVNRVKPKLIAADYAYNIDDIMDETGLPLLGLVPEDELIPVALHTKVPLVVTGAKGAAGAMLRITRRLLGEQVPLIRMKQWKVEL